MTNCYLDGYDLILNVEHQRKEKCLHFNGKWRQVCLACGRIEIDGYWYKITEIDAQVPQSVCRSDQGTLPHLNLNPLPPDEPLIR